MPREVICKSPDECLKRDKYLKNIDLSHFNDRLNIEWLIAISILNIKNEVIIMNVVW